jgi:hypothetical protein
MATPGSKPRDLFDNQESQLRYEAYSRLQAAAVAFGDQCSLPIPEIVAIGGQSDGKSSLMEAFLGVSVRHSGRITHNCCMWMWDMPTS